MDTKVNLIPDGEARIVYVRPVTVSELPDEIRAQAEGLDTLYAVHRPDGERLALVKERVGLG